MCVYLICGKETGGIGASGAKWSGKAYLFISFILKMKCFSKPCCKIDILFL